MKFLSISSNITPSETVCEDPIHLFTQFFVPDNNATRLRELQFCLRKNVSAKHIHQIHLLGERIYTDAELSIKSNKIVQTVIGHRLTFQDVFSYILMQNII
jgi:hypothetical protein